MFIVENLKFQLSPSLSLSLNYYYFLFPFLVVNCYLHWPFLYYYQEHLFLIDECRPFPHVTNFIGLCNIIKEDFAYSFTEYFSGSILDNHDRVLTTCSMIVCLLVERPFMPINMLVCWGGVICSPTVKGKQECIKKKYLLKLENLLWWFYFLYQGTNCAGKLNV